MATLLWDGNAWINGKLGLQCDEPEVPLHVEQAGLGELARFFSTAHGGLKIAQDAAGAAIQGLTHTLGPGPLAVNAAGGDVALGASGSTTRVKGELQVDGKLTVAGRDISTDGATLDAHVAAKDNPHSVTAVQIGAFALSGGTLTGALTVQGALTTTGAGTINGRNVAADGANLDSHLANRINPHEVTSQQIGALPIAGGAVTGSLSVKDTTTLQADLFVAGSVGIGVSSPTRKLEIAGSTGNLLWAGASSGSEANIELSGHVQLREFGTGGLAYFQARDDTSNRDIGLRIRTQKAGTKDPSATDAVTIDGSGRVGIGIGAELETRS